MVTQGFRPASSGLAVGSCLLRGPRRFGGDRVRHAALGGLRSWRVAAVGNAASLLVFEVREQ